MQSKGRKDLSAWALDADEELGRPCEVKPPRKGRWAGKAGAAQAARQHAMEVRRRYKEHWASYFEEVDEFDLLEESPEKPAHIRMQGAPLAPRPSLAGAGEPRRGQSLAVRGLGAVQEDDAYESPLRALASDPSNPSAPAGACDETSGESDTESAITDPSPGGHCLALSPVPAGRVSGLAYNPRFSRRSSVLLLPRTPGRLSLAAGVVQGLSRLSLVPGRPSLRQSLLAPAHRTSMGPGRHVAQTGRDVGSVPPPIVLPTVGHVPGWVGGHDGGVPAVILEEDGGEGSGAADLSALDMMLVECGQPLDPTRLPCLDALLREHVDLSQVRKIGEGTFGEAFKGQRDGKSLVFKIVPMEGSCLVNGERQKTAEEMLAEVTVSLRLSGLREGFAGGHRTENATRGFVELSGAAVCRGSYSESLLAQWRRWDAENRSENDDPGMFPADQLYVVFIVADGGFDLESFELRGFAECRSLLLQVALTLAVAEEACEFEHRDLHWGNILLRRSGGAPLESRYRLNGVDIAAKTHGIETTLIDFSLSRLAAPGGALAFCDLSADNELFAGPKGNVQADTYRRMKKLTRGRWAGFHPGTNCLWMHYLADVLLTVKGAPLSPAEKHDLKGFRKRALGYASCGELVWDELFEGEWEQGCGCG